jgi:hypothetical protein
LTDSGRGDRRGANPRRRARSAGWRSGSHLEILQREDGCKGFTQTGIDEIILKTDPRAAEQNDK